MKKKSRLIIYSPHWDQLFGETLWNWWYKKRAISKYSYLVRELVNSKHKNINVLFYVDRPKMLGFIPFFAELKFLLWAYVNGLNLLNVKTITNKTSIKKGDVFFALGRSGLKKNNLDFLKHLDIKKIFHLTHYMTDTSLMAMKADYIGVDCFVSENNLSKNSEYFRRFFYYYKKNVYVLPFVFEDRFINYQSFGDRRNKVFVSGSLTLWDKHEHSLQDFFEFYETNNYHPGRELVLINKDKLINEMDVFVRCIDLRSNRKIRLDAHQNYYKSFNIVQKLNSYRMFMSPEEIHDLPSIGFVEGMACGSAYIGKSDPMYDDIGLKDGVHFIAYDGSLSDLKEKIHYFQLHEEELERIAITGYRFVHEHFNGEVVAKKFVDDIVNIKRSCNADCYSSFTDISV